ncbi:LEAF RUST 10 DISEASE-RESISTANCE LOCUS RECEPTOR-LIKE PROTEIN KINASE-like 2.1 [Arachis duranensis]|uniref:non-specific serine/threonine protein kinase n=1 Tax=Arachis duranensis TaxID=130453 RepID=A0A6P4DDX1_ARADU|nr:LEAF RUST 10 DISEASE-RESISTANCE LOCUS RECEPTOR-LIKE PROTEIN KINASE-like 2.1 [Arachis duranensis]
MSKAFYLLCALFSTIFMTYYADSLPICAPSDCGNDVSIKYPFWKRSGTTVGEVCGYPEFGLECSKKGYPILQLKTDKYYVTDINYVNHSITLVDIDVMNDTCPRAKNNVSIGNIPLSFSNLDMNITFYFNCSSQPSVVGAVPIKCLINGEGKKSYVFEVGTDIGGRTWTNSCDAEVTVAVKHGEIKSDDDLINGFGAAMSKGFVLDWNRAVDCAECELSDGYCAYNGTARQTLCICKDGRIVAKSCKKAAGNRWTRLKKVIIGATTAAVIAGLMSICYFTYKLPRWREKYSFPTKGNQDIETFLKNHGVLTIKRYKFSDVKKMTNSFKVKLGQGGFGVVYKGKLSDGSNVAVKMLNPSKGNGKEFINEVASISRTSHVNVVTLFGFCFEGRKKVLIYEFISNGSLDKYIYRKEGVETTTLLSWDKLYQIAKGIARGLEYLHRGCNTQILHFDIKPHNILLDENFCPKISDFGLAKLCPGKESLISMSDARGTIGYIAPEVWNRHFGKASHKSDVYSYGMMLLDIVGGKKNINVEGSQTSEIYFPDWIYKKLEQGTQLGPEDGVVAIEENELVKKMTIVGLWCIQTIPNDRPTMSKVVEMLEGSIDSIKMPPRPALSSPVRSIAESSTLY